VSAPVTLDVAATTLGPLIALIAGFEGVVWFLRRRLGEPYEHAPLREVEGTGD
jgi:hypothetical protein